MKKLKNLIKLTEFIPPKEEIINSDILIQKTDK